MTCSNCGTENEAGLKFCDECASPLVRLGAVPFVTRLDAATERSPGSTPAAVEVTHPGAARSGTPF